MKTHVTRCPHCQTTFRVSDDHLKIAQGAVRCGSCLQVFKADQYFVTPIVKAAAPQADVAQSQPQSTPSDVTSDVTDAVADITEDDDDELLFHDDMDLENDPDDTPDIISDNPTEDYNLKEPEQSHRPKPRSDLELSDDIFEMKAVSSDIELVDPDFMTDSSDRGVDDDAWADALLQDDDLDDISMGGLELTDANHFADAGVDLPTDLLTEDDIILESDDDFDDDEELLPEEEEEAYVKPSLDQLQDAPLDLRTNTGSSLAWGWGLGSVLMLLIGVAQLAYFQFDAWSRTPQWRPYYAWACESIGCQLPQVQNTQTMVTQHLVVRSHPRLQGALLVDTLLKNQANYAQPFPDLTLVFEDLNGQVVASRRFTPNEYLSGEMSGQQQMPSQTPIHVALEILDPGSDAVSYKIFLLNNQPK